MAGYYCHVCGQYHDGLPMAYGFDPPGLLVPPEEREGRVVMNEDVCIIDNDTFLVRGCLEIPVIDDTDEDFEWGVWVSLSEKNFNRTLDLWDSKGREHEPPYFGWLMTRIPGYPDTMLLKTNVQTREVGVRPLVILEPTDHPLAVEQREGITLARVEEIAGMMLHPA